jgi:transposase InsO family protein
MYVAVVIDLFSRQVVGWAINDHMRTSLCLDALQMAFWRRKPESGSRQFNLPILDNDNVFKKLAFTNVCTC